MVDATEPDAVLATLTGDTDLRTPLGSHQIEVLSSRQTYMRGGAFCKRTMIDFWDQSVGAALRDPRFTFARAVGEMTWALRDIPGAAELVSYESELNRFLPQYPQVILCLYDLERFSGEMVVDIMKTHPKVLVGGAVVENPYYLDPDAFLATIERHKISSVLMVPTHFQRLLALPPEVRARYDVSSLMAVRHTGAACPREVRGVTSGTLRTATTRSKRACWPW